MAQAATVQLESSDDEQVQEVMATSPTVPGSPVELKTSAIKAGRKNMGAAETMMAAYMKEHVPQTPTTSVGPSNSEDEFDDENDSLEDAFWQSLKSNNFRFTTQATKGNAVAGRWARMLKSRPDVKADYDKTIGNKAKAEFRAKWAKEEYDSYKDTKTFSESHEIEDTTTGTWLSLAKIAVEEGGGDAGLSAAMNYAMEAIKAGRGWAKYHKWTKQPKFRYVVEGDNEKSKRKWERQQQWQKQRDLTGKAVTASKAPLLSLTDQVEQPSGSETF